MRMRYVPSPHVVSQWCFYIVLLGLAFIGTLCQYGDSVSIVEEQGGFQSVGTTAHEIGHRYFFIHPVHSIHKLYGTLLIELFCHVPLNHEKKVGWCRQTYTQCAVSQEFLWFVYTKEGCS